MGGYIHQENDNMEKEIKKRLKAKGLKESDLTAEEMVSLKKQIIAEQNGAIYLDGVLHSVRRRKDREEMQAILNGEE